MKFCGFCGQQIPDDANACPYCGSFQDSAAPAAPAKKPFPVKTLVAALVALAVVVGLVFAAKAIFGGGYKKPLDTLCDIANDKNVSESVLKDAARCVAGDVGKKDVDAAIDEVCGLKADGTKLISFLKDRVDDELDDLEDYLGKNVKFSYEIEDKDVVYTYQAQIIKHKDTASGDPMSDVEFQLQTSTGSTVPVVQIDDGEYRLPVSGETGTTTTLKTDANGKIVIKGLENGTYYLKETKTASGYNLFSAPVELTLNITEATAWSTSSTFDANGKLVKHTYTSGTTTFGGNTTPATSLYSKDVVNKKGFTLPQTGGFGTLTLSIIGCALVVGGALVLTNSKKRAK